MSSRDKYQAIPDPQIAPESLLATGAALKETVEVLAGQRKPRASAAVTWNDLLDLGLITVEQIPR